MKATFSLGRYRGIPVGAHWSTLLTILLFADLLAVEVFPAAGPGAAPWVYWVVALVVAIVFLAAVLAHEIGHAALARRRGVHVSGIVLWMLGGTTAFEDEPGSPKAEAQIAVIGPAVSAAAGAVFLGLATAAASWLPGLGLAALVWLGSVNLLIAAFNLLPAAPLDGGRILHAWLWHRGHDRDRASARTALIGRGFGQVLVVLGLLELILWSAVAGIWLAVLGLFLTITAAAERAGALLGSRLDGVTVADVMTSTVQAAPGWWTVDAFLDHVSDDRIRHRVFPVLDFDGRPVGVVGFADFASVPADRRMQRRVREVCRPLGTHALALPYEPLPALLRRAAPRAGRDLVVVTREQRLLGVLTASDLAWALELSRLGKHPAGSARPADDVREP